MYKSSFSLDYHKLTTMLHLKVDTHLHTDTCKSLARKHVSVWVCGEAWDLVSVLEQHRSL